MSILSITAIEILTFLELGRSPLFFGGWAVLFAVLCLWELSSEIKRSVKTDIKPEAPSLRIQQKPLIVIELDANGQPKEAASQTSAKETHLQKLKRRIQRIKALDDCALTIFFSILTIANLVLCLLASLLNWV